MISSQEQAYSLLKSNPEKLLDNTDYQEVIYKVVTKFFAKGFFKNCQLSDIINTIKTTLLENKLEQMKQNYKPQFNIQIKYFERLVFSLCQELHNTVSQAA